MLPHNTNAPKRCKVGEAKISAVQASFETKLAETKSDMRKWMFGALAAQTAFLSLIKFFGH